MFTAKVMAQAWRGCQSGRRRVLDQIVSFAETRVAAHDAWRSVRVDGADTPIHFHSGADLGTRETSQLFVGIEDDALTGGQDFLQSSVQQKCFRADRLSAR